MLKDDLFNVSVPEIPEKAPRQAETTRSVGVIVVKQSAVTFAGAPVFVTLVWKVLGAAIPSFAGSKLCALALSILMGIAIYAASETPGKTFREKFSGYFFAFINSFAIAATVLGIDSTMITVGTLP